MGTLKVCSVAFYLKKIMDDSTYENIKTRTIKNITTPNILFFFKVVLDFLRIIELMLSVRHNFSSPEKSPHHRIFEIYIVVFCLFGFVCCCYFFFFNVWWSQVDYSTSQNLRTFNLLWCHWQVNCSKNMETPSPANLSCGYTLKAPLPHKLCFTAAFIIFINIIFRFRSTF